MLRYLTCFFLFVCIYSSQAQEVWSLEKCIQYAQENNIDVKQTLISVQQAELTEKQNKMSRLPNLSGFVSASNNYGRTINPVTDAFVNQSLFSNGYSLSSNMAIFQGGSIHNSVKQSQYNAAASRADAESIKNNISLSVANAYLQILFAEEQLSIARQQLQQTQDQLNQTERLIQAGTRPANERFDIEAQLAQNEQNIINQENALAINYLTLKQLLLLEPDYDLVIERPDIATPDENIATVKSLSDVYPIALQSQPQIKAGELRMQSAELGIPLARASMLPSLGLGGSLNTNYAKLTGVGIQNDSYADQLDLNFGQSIGLQLNIPIYSRHTNIIQIERAKLDIINTELSNLNVKQQLKTDIQRAIADARAAAKALTAAKKTVAAREVAFNNAKRKYDLGAINSFEFTTSKNNFEQSQIDLIVAKYDYLFKLKIVDFYEGKKITLD